MAIKVSKRDVIWSYIGTVFSLGASFIMLPFMMRFLSAEQIGVYSIFISISAIAQLFSVGFGPCFARNIAYCWTGASVLQKAGVKVAESNEPNIPLLKKTIVSCKVIYAFLSILCLLFIGVIGTIYFYRVTDPITGNNHIIAWYIFVIALFLNLFFGYFNSFLSGVGDIADINRATIYSKIIQIFITVVLLFLHFELIAYSIGFLVCGVSFRIISSFYFNRFQSIQNKISFCTVITSKNDVVELLRIMWPNAWRDGIVSFANYMLNQASTIIISLFLPLAETGIYSLSVQLVTAVSTVAATMYNTYMPSLQSAAVLNDKDKMKRYMSVIVVVYTVVFIIGMIGVIFLILPILQVIKPDYIFSIPVILIAGLYQFILKLRNCYVTYFSSTNRVIYAKAFMISAVICVALSYSVLRFFSLGVYGLLFVQIFSQMIYNAWNWLIKAHRELDLKPKEMIGFSIEELKGLINISK